MKKINLFFGTLLITLAFTVSMSCKKGNGADDCSDLISRADAAGLTYTQNPTTANCQAYKTAINNLLSCPVITPQERTAYQQLLTQLTC